MTGDTSTDAHRVFLHPFMSVEVEKKPVRPAPQSLIFIKTESEEHMTL